MLRRPGLFVALTLVATFALAACGSQSGGVEPTVTRIPDAANAPIPPTATVPGAEPAATEPPENNAGGEGAAAAAQTTFDIEMVDFAFGLPEITVPANTEITINLSNAGISPHNLAITELQVASKDLASTETQTFTFNSGPAGTYEFFCSIPGHREMGMVGRLIVTDAAAAEGTPAAALPTAPAEEGAAATTFDIEMTDFAFSMAEIVAPANAEITINLTNAGVAPHNLSIPDLQVASEDVSASGTFTLTFNSGAAGTHKFICSISGHEQLGMVGNLVVQ